MADKTQRIAENLHETLIELVYKSKASEKPPIEVN